MDVFWGVDACYLLVNRVSSSRAKTGSFCWNPSMLKGRIWCAVGSFFFLILCVFYHNFFKFYFNFIEV